MRFVTSLPSTFPAGVLESTRRLAVREVPQWPLESYGDPDLMLIEVEACGVCGSDLRYYAGENPWAQNVLGRFVPNPPNIVLGHEYAGTVVRVLDEANAHWLGKRVAPICSKVCGVCADCRSGRAHLCANTVHLGHGQGWGEQPFYPGAYGRYAPAWGSECFELPDAVDFAEGAMMDILAVGVHAARQGGDIAGRPVLCIGVGPAGNAIAQAAAALGASLVVMLDRSPVALGVARAQGFGMVVDGRVPGFQDELARYAPAGFGAVYDSVGSKETLDLGLSMLGRMGALVMMATHEESYPLWQMRLGAERRLTTSCNFERADFEQALAWLAEGRLRVREWFTEVELTDLPGLFERAVADGDKAAFKWLIRPTQLADSLPAK
jgi:threonine dehydrogenase-like Zn-dependent dehydrogenase